MHSSHLIAWQRKAGGRFSGKNHHGSKTTSDGIGAWALADRDEQPEMWEDIDYASSESEDDMDQTRMPGAAHTDAHFIGKFVKNNVSEAEENLDQALDNIFTTGIGQLPVVWPGDPAYELQQKPAAWTAEGPLIRETICMLCGLSTDTYTSREDGTLDVADGLQLRDISSSATISIAKDLARLGTQVESARKIVQAHETSPVMRTFQTEIRAHLLKFYDTISGHENDTMSYSRKYRSLISLFNGVTQASMPLKALLNIALLRKSPGHATENALLLDDLIEAILQQQVVGSPFENVTMQALVGCFNRCFAIFWRPISIWFSTGVYTRSTESFIRSSNEGAISLQNFWRDAYAIVESHSPKFLHSHLVSILTAGKTTAFLSRISSCSAELRSKTGGPGRSILLIEPQASELKLVQETIDASLRRLCLEECVSMKRSLMKELCEHWHLHNTVHALQQVYLAEHGNINDKVNVAIFKLLDEGKRWKDRFLLTDIFQANFEKIFPIPYDRLTVTVDFDHRSSNARERSLVKLEAIKIHCAISQPLANIIEPPVISILQRIAVFLMQIGRAKNCLDQNVGNKSRGRSHMMRLGVLQMNLEHRMRWFVNLIHNYISLDVLSPSVDTLWDKLSKSEDVDAAIKELARFGASLEQGCFLSKGLIPTQEAVVSLFDLSVVLMDTRGSDQAMRIPTSNNSSKGESTQSTDHTRSAGDTQAVNSGKLMELHNSYQQLVTFIHAGVKDGARFTGDSRMELLASDIALEIALLKKQNDTIRATRSHS